MKHNFIYLTTLLLSLSLFSCSNDDDDKPEEMLQVSEMVVDNGNKIKFTYDVKNRLDTVEVLTKASSNSKESLDFLIFSYNGDGSLARYINKSKVDGVTSLDYVTVLSKPNNVLHLEVKKEEAGGLALDRVDILLFDANNRLKEITQGDSKKTIEYDSKGNVTKVYNDGVVLSEYTEYDVNKNIHTNNGLPKWFWIYHNSIDANEAGVNNVKEMTVEPGASGYSTSYTYVYNPQGFPIKVIQENKKNNTSVTTTVSYRTVEIKK